MAWVRVDDQAPRHEKLLKAGPAAAWLWVCGLAHAQSQLTDGVITDAALPFIGVAKGAKDLARRLVSVHLWIRIPGGFRVHDYHDFNFTRAETLARRKATREHRRRAGLASWQQRKAKSEQTGDRGVQHRSEQTADRFVQTRSEQMNNRRTKSSLNPIPSHPSTYVRTPLTPLKGGTRRRRKRAQIPGTTCHHSPRCRRTADCIARTLADGKAAKS